MSVDKKIVFIMGPGHCGSTLLDLILGSHSNVFSMGELHTINSLLYPDIKTDGAIQICDVCVNVCDFWNKRASIPILKIYFSRKHILQRVLARIARYIVNPYLFLFAWSGKSILIDSSKQPWWIIQQLRAPYALNGVQPYLLYMCRDGRAVVNSYLRKYPERGIVQTTEIWMDQIKRMNDFYQSFPADRRMRVQYEELATHPEKISKGICQFLNIAFQPDMLRYWVHDHHIIRGNAGTRSLIYKYRMKFKSSNKDLITRDEHERNYYDNNYYNEVGLAINLDQRWMRELTREQLDIFDSLADELNRDLAYKVTTVS